MNYFYYDEALTYPRVEPFMPMSVYEEYPFSKEELTFHYENMVYEVIRKMFLWMKLDSEHIGSKHWNPLGDFIHKGQTVLIKPNLVNHFNPAEEDTQRCMDCLVTYPTIVRCLLIMCIWR